ncbi:MAG: hypothetical protein R3A10_22875 [Caldilineaceae bacterium]
MTGYIVRRLLQAIPLLIVISIIVFGMISLAPGAPCPVLRGKPLISRPKTWHAWKSSLASTNPSTNAICAGPVASSWATGATAIAPRRPVLTEIGVSGCPTRCN